jgi:hypothetical protein
MLIGILAQERLHISHFVRFLAVFSVMAGQAKIAWLHQKQLPVIGIVRIMTGKAFLSHCHSAVLDSGICQLLLL